MNKLSFWHVAKFFRIFVSRSARSCSDKKISSRKGLQLFAHSNLNQSAWHLEVTDLVTDSTRLKRYTRYSKPRMLVYLILPLLIIFKIYFYQPKNDLNGTIRTKPVFETKSERYVALSKNGTFETFFQEKLKVLNFFVLSWNFQI